MQLDGLDTCFRRCFYLSDVRIDKQADADVVILQLINRSLYAIAVTDNVEPAFGCDFFAFFRNERGLFRQNVEGDVDNLLLDCHFQIQFHSDHLTQDTHVAILDMATIFSQMHCNAIRSAQFG